MIFDTHTHYSDQRFDNDRHSLLMSMEENGIGNIVEAGAGIKSTKEAVKLSEEYSFIYAAVGIHPYETADIKEEDMEWLKSLALNKKVVAVSVEVPHPEENISLHLLYIHMEPALPNIFVLQKSTRGNDN